MEHADGGDLLKKIDTAKRLGRKFEEKDCWSYFIQIINGLKALHDHKIVHRDIKCANIFLTSDGTIKLGDLNVSKVQKIGLLRTQTGTPYYACPEVWNDKPYDKKSDIWSAGCVLFEMCALDPPFKGKDMRQLCERVTAGRVPPLPIQYSKDMTAIVKKCLQTMPSLRPTCEELLAKQEIIKNLPSNFGLQDNDNAELVHKDNLIDTIRVPRNLGMINDKLPKANYEGKRLIRA